MVGRYVLLGLLAAAFLPACINAAEQPVENKPTLLIVANTKDAKDLTDSGLPYVLFSDLVARAVGPTFDVKTIMALSVLPGDLRKVNYVLFASWTPGFSDRDLTDTGLDKFPNKAFVLFYQPSIRPAQHAQGYPEYVPGEINRFMREMFQRAFSLQFEQKEETSRVRTRSVKFLFKQDSSKLLAFQRFLQSLVENFQQGLLPTPREQEQRTPLQNRLNDFYWELNSVNPVLAQKYSELLNELGRAPKSAPR